jgi:hypothetical protein
LEDGLAQPLLTETKESRDENVQDDDDKEEDHKECHKPATSLAAAYRLLTPSVKVFFLSSTNPIFDLLDVPASYAFSHTYALHTTPGSVIDLLHAQVYNGNSTLGVECCHLVLF